MKKFLFLWIFTVCLSFAFSQWTQEEKYTAQDGVMNNYFGASVCTSGNFSIVGSYGNESYRGAAYVIDYTTSDSAQKLVASDGVASDVFGVSVSLHENFAIVGAYGDDGAKGAAYIYFYDGNTWSEQQKLTASDGVAGDYFGISVGIYGNFAIVGAYADDGAKGAAYVFYYNGSSWSQTAKLTASDGAGADYFGYSVAISGDNIIIGSMGDDDDGSFSGSAYVFHYGGATWSQQQKLTASDGATGDSFGNAVSIDSLSNFAVVGAHHEGTNGYNAGAAYIFSYDGSWTEDKKILASDGAAEDYFGTSVCVSENAVIVGSPGDDDSGAISGSAYFFLKHENWSQSKIVASDGESEDYFGERVSLYGSHAFVSARLDDDIASDSGAVYYFKINPLPITLLSFTAKQMGDYTHICWETATEIRTIGFHLLRSAEKKGKYKRFTGFIIPSQGGAFWGAKYSYNDVSPQGECYYKLEEISETGKSEFHGPILAK